MKHFVMLILAFNIAGCASSPLVAEKFQDNGAQCNPKSLAKFVGQDKMVIRYQVDGEGRVTKAAVNCAQTTVKEMDRRQLYLDTFKNWKIKNMPSGKTLSMEYPFGPSATLSR